MNRTLIAALLVLPSLALANIGKVSTLTGSATRSPCTDDNGEQCPAAIPLKAGDTVSVKDRIQVDRGGAVRVVMNDETVIKIGGPEGASFFFKEAQFAAQTNERQGFWGSLSFGSVWANVKKAVVGSDQKFKVSAGRAVAGVRGTIFRIDASIIPQASGKSGVKSAKLDAKAAPKMRTVVMVQHGVVGVDAQFKSIATNVAGQKKGERKQVAGPQEISKDEWEKKFVELQKGMQVTITDDGFTPAPMNEADLNKQFEGFE